MPIPAKKNHHPVTQISTRMCLSDEFHKVNLSKPKDYHLRSASHIKEIRGRIDSVGHEQFFAKMTRNRFFMNNMSSTSHMLAMRLLFNDYNIHKNNQRVKSWSNSLGIKIEEYSSTRPVNDNSDVKEVGEDGAIGLSIDLDHDETGENTTDNNHGNLKLLATSSTTISPDKALVSQDNSDTIVKLLNTIKTILNSACRSHLSPDDKKVLLNILEIYEHDIPSLPPGDLSKMYEKIKYIQNTILGPLPPDISELFVEDRYIVMQYQGDTSLCGLAALNNALGLPGSDSQITSEEMCTEADSLWIQQLQHGLTLDVEKFRDSSGNFSIEVLRVVAKQRGFEMEYVNAPHDGCDASNNKVLQHIQQTSARGAVLLRPQDRYHFYTAIINDKDVKILDSQCLHVSEKGRTEFFRTLFETCESSTGAVFIFCSDQTNNQHEQQCDQHEGETISDRTPGNQNLNVTHDTEISISSASSKSTEHSISLQNTNLSEIWLSSNYDPSDRIVLCPENIDQPYLTISDLHTLKPGCFVNNAVIDFSVAELSKGSYSTLYLSTLFVQLLQKNMDEIDIPLSQYNAILIPVHDSKLSHWWAIIIDVTNGIYAELDSLKVHRRDTQLQTLITNWAERHGLPGLSKYRTLTARERRGLPQQGHKPDCGLFCITWALQASLKFKLRMETLKTIASRLRTTVGEYIVGMSQGGLF